MPDTPILVEIYPVANVTTQLYTVPNLHTTSGTVFAMNQDNINDHVSIGLVPNQFAISSNSWIAYNTEIYHGQSLYLQQIFLNSGDQIWVNSVNGTSNFIFNGTLDPTTI
jgi:hypothetical protein